MNTMLAGFFGGWEIVLILAMALLLFGAKKLPELAKGLGQGIKEFKKATREVTDEMENAMHDNNPPPPPQKTLPPGNTIVTSSEPAQAVPQNPPGQKA
ncbi:MAG TPA: twin-arginine translocase TatA/TatE family subunit [Verrucomicrobiae bacterium]|nr:twin-arginine translocase TatA/TatE family subunit [Verrucomicrobiae bacterium]